MVLNYMDFDRKCWRHRSYTRKTAQGLESLNRERRQQQLNSFEFVRLVIFFVPRVMNANFFSLYMSECVQNVVIHIWMRALCCLIKIITCQTSIGLLWQRNICCDKKCESTLWLFHFIITMLALLNSMQRICRQETMIHIPQAVELAFKKIRKLNAALWMADWMNISCKYNDTVLPLNWTRMGVECQPAPKTVQTHIFSVNADCHEKCHAARKQSTYNSIIIRLILFHYMHMSGLLDCCRSFFLSCFCSIVFGTTPFLRSAKVSFDNERKVLSNGVLTLIKCHNIKATT